ncbi:hypothetical protein PISL3812_05422 [Talaromyces islandicus]|uniref:Uncharacterized protein n=1 Tax=Talaromyces islandicus TaxID=28573 RepID=A0A0U1LZ59_TALIS|nr:hypothetical protein PISL3812_05422 [Talaromyces islandicus]
MDTFNEETGAKEVIKKLGIYAEGKIYLITGGSNASIGGDVAIELAAAKPKLIILASRSEAKILPVLEAIHKVDATVEAVFVYLDLLDNSTVYKAVDKIKNLTPKIDTLVNNAGIMGVKAYSTSKDGVESQFATNYLGHFLLTNLLLKEGLLTGDGSLIVNDGSLGYQLADPRLEDPNFNANHELQDGKEYNGWKAYGQAKSSLYLFTWNLAEKLRVKGIPVLAVHPGVTIESHLLANSAIDQEWFGEAYKLAIERNNGNPLPPQHLRSLTQATAAVLSTLLDPSIRDKAPASFVEHRPYEPLPYVTDLKSAEKLWALSEKLVGQKFDL